MRLFILFWFYAPYPFPHVVAKKNNNAATRIPPPPIPHRIIDQSYLNRISIKQINKPILYLHKCMYRPLLALAHFLCHSNMILLLKTTIKPQYVECIYSNVPLD